MSILQFQGKLFFLNYYLQEDLLTAMEKKHNLTWIGAEAAVSFEGNS